MVLWEIAKPLTNPLARKQADSYLNLKINVKYNTHLQNVIMQRVSRYLFDSCLAHPIY